MSKEFNHFGCHYRRISRGFLGIKCIYQITRDFIIRDCGWYPKKRVVTHDIFDSPVVTNEPSGLMIVHAGFICDGPSFLTYDRPENRVAAFGHDAGYYQCRSGKVANWQAVKVIFDELYGKMCAEAGMVGWWARVNTWGTLKFGKSSAEPQLTDAMTERHE